MKYVNQFMRQNCDLLPQWGWTTVSWPTARQPPSWPAHCLLRPGQTPGDQHDCGRGQAPNQELVTSVDICCDIHLTGHCKQDGEEITKCSHCHVVMKEKLLWAGHTHLHLFLFRQKICMSPAGKSSQPISWSITVHYSESGKWKLGGNNLSSSELCAA